MEAYCKCCLKYTYAQNLFTACLKLKFNWVPSILICEIWQS